MPLISVKHMQRFTLSLAAIIRLIFAVTGSQLLHVGRMGLELTVERPATLPKLPTTAVINKKRAGGQGSDKAGAKHSKPMKDGVALLNAIRTCILIKQLP